MPSRRKRWGGGSSVARVALAYNLIHEESLENAPVDSIAELDSPETVAAVKKALEEGGHSVVPVEADEAAFEAFRCLRGKIDIVFNISEGIRGEARESFVPAILEMLGIPYTGSGPLCLAACLDKAHAKKILAFHKIPTPLWQVFTRPGGDIDQRLRFPLIVKLASEGSSMGLTYDSVVQDARAADREIQRLFRDYAGPVLVEEFVGGPEYGFPIVGNDPPILLPIIQIHYHGPQPISIFTPDSELEIFRKIGYEIPDGNAVNECPARIEPALEASLRDLALRSYQALGCLDWCRLEIRLDLKGNPFVIELNPIAGIDPSYRFAQSALKAGWSFAALINRILDSAMARYGLLR